ncbi:MAG TPA: nicotinamide riboside transporter PnuC, partial [Candidatus Obscuribacterales bacterium]
MTDFLSINTIAFTILGYPMSYIELIGTILYLGSVWLIAQKHMLTWPVGILSVLLYMSLFYQIQLYSDALEQVYYLVASAYGWWWWSRKGPDQDVTDGFFYSRRRYGLLTLGITLGVGLAL